MKQRIGFEEDFLLIELLIQGEYCALLNAKFSLMKTKRHVFLNVTDPKLIDNTKLEKVFTPLQE